MYSKSEVIDGYPPISKSDNFESRKKENVYTEQMLTDEGEKEMFYLIAKRVENDKEIGDIC